MTRASWWIAYAAFAGPWLVVSALLLMVLIAYDPIRRERQQRRRRERERLERREEAGLV